MAVLPAAMTLLEAAKLGDDNAFEILLQPLLEPGYRLAGGMLQDQTGLDRANYLLNAQGVSVGTMFRSVVQSREGSNLPYVESLRTANQNLAVCTGCRPLERTGSVDCAAIQTAVCEADIVYATSDVESVEAALVSVGAPSSLEAQDALLQRDLARADSGLLAMANAQLTDDQAGFDAGRQVLQQALSMVEADIAGILGG